MNMWVRAEWKRKEKKVGPCRSAFHNMAIRYISEARGKLFIRVNA